MKLPAELSKLMVDLTSGSTYRFLSTTFNYAHDRKFSVLILIGSPVEVCPIFLFLLSLPGELGLPRFVH